MSSTDPSTTSPSMHATALTLVGLGQGKDMSMLEQMYSLRPTLRESTSFSDDEVLDGHEGTSNGPTSITKPSRKLNSVSSDGVVPDGADSSPPTTKRHRLTTDPTTSASVSASGQVAESNRHLSPSVVLLAPSSGDMAGLVTASAPIKDTPATTFKLKPYSMSFKPEAPSLSPPSTTPTTEENLSTPTSLADLKPAPVSIDLTAGKAESPVTEDEVTVQLGDLTCELETELCAKLNFTGNRDQAIRVPVLTLAEVIDAALEKLINQRLIPLVTRRVKKSLNANAMYRVNTFLADSRRTLEEHGVTRPEMDRMTARYGDFERRLLEQQELYKSLVDKFSSHEKMAAKTYMSARTHEGKVDDLKREAFCKLGRLGLCLKELAVVLMDHEDLSGCRHLHQLLTKCGISCTRPENLQRYQLQVSPSTLDNGFDLAEPTPLAEVTMDLTEPNAPTEA